MGGPGFVLSLYYVLLFCTNYFNKFACKVGYLMVTRKVIALICLTESRLFFAVKVLSGLSQAILWLTKAHQSSPTFAHRAPQSYHASTWTFFF